MITQFSIHDRIFVISMLFVISIIILIIILNINNPDFYTSSYDKEAKKVNSMTDCNKLLSWIQSNLNGGYSDLLNSAKDRYMWSCETSNSVKQQYEKLKEDTTPAFLP